MGTRITRRVACGMLAGKSLTSDNPPHTYPITVNTKLPNTITWKKVAVEKTHFSVESNNPKSLELRTRKLQAKDMYWSWSPGTLSFGVLELEGLQSPHEYIDAENASLQF